jgi:hypothetical protein
VKRFEVDGQVGGRRRLDRQKRKKRILHVPARAARYTVFLRRTRLCLEVQATASCFNVIVKIPSL